VIEHVDVSGEPVRLIALPRVNAKSERAWQKFVESDDILGLDVESDTGDEGMGTYSPSVKMRLIQFGNDHEAWAFDPQHPVWRMRVIALLSDIRKRFVSHNAAFDTTRVWFEFGITLGDRSIDTLPMAALLWPGVTARKGLKSLCDTWIDNGLSDADQQREARFTDLFYANKPRKGRLLPQSFVPGESLCRKPPSKGIKCGAGSWPGSLIGYCYEHWLTHKGNKESESWGWANVALDDPYYIRYAGLDAVYVRRLLDILARKIALSKMRRLSGREQRIKRQMTAVSLKGHRVDGEWTKPILDEVEEEYDALNDAIEQRTGLTATQNVRLKEWFAEHGVRVTSLDKNHLPDLIETYTVEGDDLYRGPEVAATLHDLTEVSLRKNLLVNLRTIYRHATQGDGFTHADIKTMQAHTGRMSITDPAMQTFAKKGEKGHRLRGCYIARDGYVLVGADYDSQETRLAAAYSRDPALLRVVLEGLNQHDLTAHGLWPDYTDKATEPDRYAKAKTLNYAQQYGAMPKKIAATLGIDYDEAREMWSAWRHTYAGLVDWSERMSQQDAVRNAYGRLIPRDPFRDYASGNYVIQSTGRDILGAALCRLEDAGWAPYFWLPIHDEMVLEVPEDRADEAANALTELMSTEVLGISIPAEGEVIGTRWRGL
jgi:DNA polymerase-1